MPRPALCLDPRSPLPAELIGYWPFDDQLETTADLSTGGNDGTVNGGAKFVPGRTGDVVDFAIEFDGVDDSVTTEVSLLGNLEAFTMAGWFRFEVEQTNRTGLFGQNDSVEFGMINQSTMQHWMAGGGVLNVPFGPTAEDWTHVAVVNSADGRILYINGGVAGEAGAASPTAASGFTFNIGGDGVYDGAGNFFEGQIDDVAVWDVVLTPEQIADLAANRVAPDGSPVSILDTDGDGIPDGLEERHGLDPQVADADTDKDEDGLTAFQEIIEKNTDPNEPDTDGDGLLDGVETGTGTYVNAADSGTDPLEADTDGDGLLDGIEVPGEFIGAQAPGTHPLLEDTDGDGFSDGDELATGSNPLDGNSKPAFPVVIGYWSFDDQAGQTADLSPGGNHGTVNGEPEFVPGHSGHPGDFAIRFDGEDDSVTTEAKLLNDLPEFTMSLWVRFEEEQPNRTGFFGQNDAVEFGMINATTMQHWSASGGALNVEFGPTVEEWTHVAIVNTPEGRLAYANGEEIGAGGASGPVSSGSNVNIGGDGVYDPTGNFFKGEIDDVALWDVALTAEQIAELASGTVCPLGACGGARFSITQVTRDVQGLLSLSWTSFPGQFFDVEASPNLTAGSWTPVLTDLPAAGDPTTETSATLQSSGPQDFYRVTQVPPPPFLETSFEDGAPDWSLLRVPGGVETGTAWEIGPPANGPESARTGENAAGTGLGADYEDGTMISLRSPIVDPAGTRNLRLEFWYYLQTNEGEGGRVNLRETNGDLIQSMEQLFAGGDSNTEAWAPVTMRLPNLDPPRPFIVEFEFLSADDGDPNNGAGWFIDDLRIGK